MANSQFTIPSQSGKTAQASRNAARRSTAPVGNTQASFAAMMAREQKGQAQSQLANKNIAKSDSKNTAARQTRPVVARLPDTAGIPLNNAVLAGRSPNDLLRMQNFNKASSDLAQTKALGGLARASTSTLDMARNLNTATNLRTIAAAGNGAGFALTSNDFIHTPRAARIAHTRKIYKNRIGDIEGGIGKLSAKFESGTDGIAAIGYDGKGGTSYGKYQIASKVGSMKNFLNFLDTEAPDLAKRLRNAGPANTGSRKGRMPNVWRAIAEEQPERFEKLQEAFIHDSHYKPALAYIGERTGLDPNRLSPAMQEVIWSTAVQHGPAGAAKIFARADDMSGKPGSANYERKMITNVYNLRAGQFGSSTGQIRESVRNRFREEQQLALRMLDNGSRADMA